jgi:hypothetical protein
MNVDERVLVEEHKSFKNGKARLLTGHPREAERGIEL